jgi:hypothetical protein
MWNNYSKPKPEMPWLNYSSVVLDQWKLKHQNHFKWLISSSRAKIWAFYAVFRTSSWTTPDTSLHPHSYFLPLYDQSPYVVSSILTPRLKLCGWRFFASVPRPALRLTQFSTVSGALSLVVERQGVQLPRYGEPVALGKISLARGIHCTPNFYFIYFALPASVYCEDTYTDVIQTVYNLLLLPNYSASETYLHKCGKVRSVDCVFIIVVPAWLWLGEYVTLDK